MVTTILKNHAPNIQFCKKCRLYCGDVHTLKSAKNAQNMLKYLHYIWRNRSKSAQKVHKSAYLPGTSVILRAYIYAI